MLSLIKKDLIKLKDGNIDLVFGRDIIAQWVFDQSQSLPPNQPLRILDLGCGRGDDLETIKLKFLHSNSSRTVELYGVDSFEESTSIAQKKGIQIRNSNIESDKLPFSDQYFDVVISNQVIEHTKEIFWIFSEVSRVLKPNGISITGVPNLASFHSRLMLLFGAQPSSIELLGPHIRGILYGSFKRFIETDGYFKVDDLKGSHFYPFPRMLAQILSKIFPNASASIFIKARRTQIPGAFIKVLESRFFETPFFKG